MGPYCTWKKQPPKLSKKSKSTCFPKLWRLKDKVGDGRDAFVFLKKPVKTAVEGSPPKLSKKCNSFSKLWRLKDKVGHSNSDGQDAFLFLKKPVRTAVEGSSLKGTSGKRKGLKAENRKFSGHEVYLRKRAQGNINLLLEPDDEDDEEEYLDCEDRQEYSNHENDEECLDCEENQEYFNHENDEEFTFMYLDENNTPIPADKASKNKDIHPIFPLFDLNLLSHEERKQLPINPQVNKVSVESDQVALSSTSQCDTIESVAMGPYCTWKKQPPKLSKKSKSTCFPKLWRLKDKVGDGRDAFVFLKKPVKTAVEGSPPKLSKKCNSFSKLWRLKDKVGHSNSDGQDAFLFLKKPVRTAVEGSSLKGTSGKRKGLKAENHGKLSLLIYGYDLSFVNARLWEQCGDSCLKCTIGLSISIHILQNHLYSEGGLQAKGIFRITGENDQEKDVRKQLNIGFVPAGVDVPFFAGLIKVVTAPMTTLNAIAVEEYKKYILVSLIHLRQMPIKEAFYFVVQRIQPCKQMLWKHAQARQHAKGQGPTPVSYGSELSNRGPTFDMDMSSFMDGDQPISYEMAISYFACDSS
ncbi:hypothetical protein Tco_1393359 [Tanacetum coccineum]